ncbi:MAG: PadR family transcriptional regulator [Bacteroidetes bacterium]|nr:PadR family transcriptional regulator [Bacteroidota bacterium]
MYSKDLIKGTLQPIIIQLLHEKERMYGYEITREVKQRTAGKLEITEGALYPALHKLEADGILKTEKELHGNRIRKYYSFTSSGEKQGQTLLIEFRDFLDSMRLILNSKSNLV